MAIVMVRNMVCKRCITAVEAVFKQHNILVQEIRLGEVFIENELRQEERLAIDRDLRALGFEILSDRRSLTVERMKVAILEVVQEHDAQLETPLSVFLSRRMGVDYSALSSLFSQIEGMTVERYFILQRIERVKELISYGDLLLSEIADKMGYSSVAHMSAQFKRVTGITPSAYRDLQGEKRIPLDEVG